MTSQRQFMKDCSYRIVLDFDIFLIFSDREGFMCCKYHCNTNIKWRFADGTGPMMAQH